MKKTSAQIAQNKKARHLYELSEFMEAGIVLFGSELKSIRAGEVTFNDSYIDFKEGEAFVVGLHIAPYANAGYAQHEPTRPRKLLLHTHQINQLQIQVNQKGFTVVPVRLYFSNGRVKIEIALGRGKKLHDHRQSLKQAAENRDLERELSKIR